MNKTNTRIQKLKQSFKIAQKDKTRLNAKMELSFINDDLKEATKSSKLFKNLEKFKKRFEKLKISKRK